MRTLLEGEEVPKRISFRPVPRLLGEDWEEYNQRIKARQFGQGYTLFGKKFYVKGLLRAKWLKEIIEDDESKHL